MAGSYDIGDRVHVTAAFTVSSVATDPTTVVFKYKDPSGTITTLTYGIDPEIVRSAEGNYYVDLDVDEQGDWWYRWAGTGAVVAAQEVKFYVQPTRF